MFSEQYQVKSQPVIERQGDIEEILEQRDKEIERTWLEIKFTTFKKKISVFSATIPKPKAFANEKTFLFLCLD